MLQRGDPCRGSWTEWVENRLKISCASRWQPPYCSKRNQNLSLLIVSEALSLEVMTVARNKRQIGLRKN